MLTRYRNLLCRNLKRPGIEIVLMDAVSLKDCVPARSVST